MEYLLQFINYLGSDPILTRGTLSIVMGIAAALAVLSLLFVGIGLTSPLRRRLATIAKTDKSGRREASGFQKIADSVSPVALPKNIKEKKKTEQRLVMAGYRSPNALSSFYALKLLGGIIAPGTILFAATYYPHFSALQVGMAALAGSFLGLIGPNILLDHRIKKRKKKILNAFPDALDLLVACTEAGLGLNNALQRVADEIDVNSPELAEELALVNSEIRAGVDRSQALMGLYERTGVEDIRGLVSLFSQTMRFGTSIADALRVYAEDFRDKRMQKAEEQAAKLGTKMIFPMAFCIFPAFFIVAIGPAILRVIAAFQHL